MSWRHRGSPCTKSSVVYWTIMAVVAGLHGLLVAQGHGVPMGDLHDLLKGPELFQRAAGAFPGPGQILGSHGPCDDYPPPLMLLGQLAFLKLTGSVRLLPLVNLLYLAAFAALFWRLARRLFDGPTALLAAMLLLGRNTFVYGCLVTGPEPLMVALYALLCLCLLRSDGLRRPLPLVLGAVAVGLMALAKVTFILHAPWPFLFLLGWAALRARTAGPGQRRPFPWRGALLFAGLSLALAAPWYLYSWDGLTCYVQNNLSRGTPALQDVLYADLAPAGLGKLLHALTMPLIFAGVGASLLLVLTRDAASWTPARARLIFARGFALGGVVPGLLLLGLVFAMGGRLEVVEMGVFLPLLMLLAAHLLRLPRQRWFRRATWGLAALLLLHNLSTFVPPDRVQRALWPARTSGARLTRLEVHEALVRTLLRVGKGLPPEVVLVNGDPRLPRVMVDPITFWYSALSMGQLLRFYCVGCRPERYEAEYELAPQARVQLRLGEVRGPVPAAARLVVIFGEARPGALRINDQVPRIRVLARLEVEAGEDAVPISVWRLEPRPPGSAGQGGHQPPGSP